jgi:N-methylhydantoinase B/oxoprolinase/acetone carboxylase alpha subunit
MTRTLKPTRFDHEHKSHCGIGRRLSEFRGWGQRGGLSGACNRFEIDFPDGHAETVMKVTDKRIPAGSRFRIYCGGGSGYGSPANRSPEAVHRDLLSGLITQQYAKRHYPRVPSGAAVPGIWTPG